MADKSKSSSLLVILFSSLIPTAIIVLALYMFMVYWPMQKSQAEAAANVQAAIGLTRQVENRLASEFTDADNDLVADWATAEKQIDPEKLVFCYIARPNPSEHEKVWKPLMDHIAKATGKPVVYSQVTSADDQTRALYDGELHIAGFNTGAVPRAVCVAGFVPMAKLGGDEGSQIQSVLIVPSSSDAKSPKDLSGKEITMTSPSSNSGFKAVLVSLSRDFQMAPETDYRIRFSRDHYASIRMIANNKAEAAPVASDLLQRAIESQQIKSGQYREIYRSQKFPPAALGVPNTLKPELAKKIEEAIFSFDWEGTTIAKEFSPRHNKFVPLDYRADWGGIRTIDNSLGDQYKLPGKVEAVPTARPAE